MTAHQRTIMHTIGLLFLCAVSAFAAQSVTVTSGNPILTLPNSAPWTTIGASTQPMRWEMRIHNFGSNWPVNGIFAGPFRLYEQTTLAWAATDTGKDTVYNNGVYVSGCCTGRSDVLVRVQRDVGNSRYTLEVCDTVGGNCLSSTSPITRFGPASWAGTNVKLYSGEGVAFFRWFSGVVPIGTAIPIIGTGDLADWEFEGNLTDSVSGLMFTAGSVNYSQSTIYPPSCNAGLQQSFRAGYSGTLDGTGSSPLDGGTTLTYTWQQIPAISPVRVRWEYTQHQAKPTVMGMVAGSYNFQLTVTDSSGQFSSCVVHDGAVATDDNGVVITNNPAVDELLGPMIQWGKSAWPWLDDRHKYVADTQIGYLENRYVPYFNIPAAGTVSLTAGSTAVVGVGTHFTTDVCQGPGNPTVPQASMAFIPWWNGGNNRRGLVPASCTDDTHLTLQSSYTWNPPVGLPQNESGLSYSLDNFYWVGVWGYAANGAVAQYPINYYDNVAAFYSLYYRSGIDTYLTYARKLADEFWASPPMDKGQAFAAGTAASPWQFPGRSVSAMGLVLRALDTGDDHPDMWLGLHLLWDLDASRITWWDGAYTPYGLFDQREDAYMLFRRAMCGLFDTSSTYRSACKASISTYVRQFLSPVAAHYGTAYFPNFTGGTLQSWGNGYQGYFSATNGSSAVTYHPQGSYSFNSANPWPGMVWMWPCATTSPANGFDCGPPGDNSLGDANWYYASYVDPTHITLTDAQGNPVGYTGSTGNKGFVYYAHTTTVGFGWGLQPFMQGILAASFDLAAQALLDGNYDTATAGTLQTYESQVVAWLKDYGMYAPAKGLWYYLGQKNCPVDGTGDPLQCGRPDPANPGAGRVLNAEAIRGATFAWYHTGRPDDLRVFIDSMVNAMFAKPGTCPEGSTDCVPDGYYLDQYDNGQFFVCCTPPFNGGNPKWFGMLFGFNPTYSWPATRLGGAQPAKLQKFRMAFNMANVRGATHVNVLITQPTGAVVTAGCDASPCEITLDISHGSHLLRLQYLSADNRVLATENVATEARPPN